MAVRETIATVDIDDAPAGAAVKRMVTGMEEIRATGSSAAQEVDREWNKAGPAFVHHMLSMRAAAGALLGGFSLAGIISEIGALGKSIVESAPHFKEMSEAATQMRTAFVGLGTAVTGADLSSVVTWMDRVTAAMELMRETAQQHGAAGDEARGFMGRLLFGSLGADWIPESLDLVAKGIDKVAGAQEAALKKNRAIAAQGQVSDMLDEFERTNSPVKYQQYFSYLNSLAGGGGFGTLGKGVASTTVGIIEKATPVMESFNRQLEDNGILLKEAIPLYSDLAGIIDPFEEWDKNLAAFNEEAKKIQEATRNAARLADEAHRASIEFQLLAFTQQQAADLIANALAGTVSDYRAFVRAALTEIARMLIVQGFENLAKAWAAAATGFGSAAATFYYRAAELDFAGAALAGLGARAAGGPSGHGAGTPQGSQIGAAGPPANQRSVSVSITVEGDFVGTDDKLREIADGIKRVLLTGAAGGTLN